MLHLTEVFVHGLGQRCHSHPLSDLHFHFVQLGFCLLDLLGLALTFDLQDKHQFSKHVWGLALTVQQPNTRLTGLDASVRVC